MARVWIYDLNNTNKFREALAKARKAGRKSPARWQVTWYDNGYHLKSEAAPTKTLAEGRRSEIERTLMEGTHIDPAAGRVRFAEMADKWLGARHDLHPSSWWKYRGVLDNHVLPRWGELPLCKMLRADEDIVVWVAALLKPRSAGGAGLGPSQGSPTPIACWPWSLSGVFPTASPATPPAA